jgi:ATP-dependent Clp protease ATP-binding subunit ClpX
MLDVMFDIPSRTDVTNCLVTKEVVLDKVHPQLTLKESKDIKEMKEPKESAKKKEESA